MKYILALLILALCQNKVMAENCLAPRSRIEEVAPLEARIRNGDQLSELKEKAGQLEVKTMWEIVLAYDSVIAEEAKRTWERKMKLWEERNFWRGKMWDVFVEESGKKKRLPWDRFSKKHEIPYKEFEKTCYDYLLEKHQGNLEEVCKESRTKDADILRRKIGHLGTSCKYPLLCALKKAQNKEDLTPDERNELLHEFLKGGHKNDPTFPRFSYREKVRGQYKGLAYILFCYARKDVGDYEINIYKEILRTFGIDGEVTVESIFDTENNRWIFKVYNEKGALCYTLGEKKKYCLELVRLEAQPAELPAEFTQTAHPPGRAGLEPAPTSQVEQAFCKLLKGKEPTKENCIALVRDTYIHDLDTLHKDLGEEISAEDLIGFLTALDWEFSPGKYVTLKGRKGQIVTFDRIDCDKGSRLSGYYSYRVAIFWPDEETPRKKIQIFDWEGIKDALRPVQDEELTRPALSSA